MEKQRIYEIKISITSKQYYQQTIVVAALFDIQLVDPPYDNLSQRIIYAYVRAYKLY